MTNSNIQSVYSDPSIVPTKCDDCSSMCSPETASVWSDVLVICDLHGKGRYAALQQEIDAMVEELRHMNDPKVPCQFCRGTGYIAAYKHVEDGVCFNCGGTGMEWNSELPADMARCKGCDIALSSGLIWGVEDAEVCPDCFEQCMGYERWGERGRNSEGRFEHTICGMVSILSDVTCVACHEIAGQKGEDW